MGKLYRRETSTVVSQECRVEATRGISRSIWSCNSTGARLENCFSTRLNKTSASPIKEIFGSTRTADFKIAVSSVSNVCGTRFLVIINSFFTDQRQSRQLNPNWGNRSRQEMS